MLNKKGFTLVELCVVMALMAIVGTLTTTLMVSFSNRSNMIRLKSASLQDISNIYQTIETWIEKYDNANYVFDGSTKVISVTSGGTEVGCIDVSDAGTMVVDGVTHSYDSIKSISFSLIKTNSNDTSKNILLRTTVTYTDGVSDDLQQLMIFTTHSNTGRGRISNPDR